MLSVATVEGGSDWWIILLAIATVTRLWRYPVEIFRRPWAGIPVTDLLIAGGVLLLAARGVMCFAAVASIGNPNGALAILISRTFANALTVIALLPISYALYGSRHMFRLLAITFLGAVILSASLLVKAYEDPAEVVGITDAVLEDAKRAEDMGNGGGL